MLNSNNNKDNNYVAIFGSMDKLVLISILVLIKLEIEDMTIKN